MLLSEIQRPQHAGQRITWFQKGEAIDGALDVVVRGKGFRYHQRVICLEIDAQTVRSGIRDFHRPCHPAVVKAGGQPKENRDPKCNIAIHR